MRKHHYAVVISANAREDLKYIWFYVKERDSVNAADYVRNSILKAIRKYLSTFPTKFSVDTRYGFDGGHARSFTIWSYHVVYVIFNNRVEVLAIVHGARENIADDA